MLVTCFVGVSKMMSGFSKRVFASSMKGISSRRFFSSFEKNGVTVHVNKRPTVVVCLDGCAPEYIDYGVKAGILPNWKRIWEKQQNTQNEYYVRVNSVVPTYTNPNNIAIVTGVPPNVNGICGNYLYDPENKTEVMMNDTKFLRCSTLFEAYQEHGDVVIVTAKDKLLKLLSHNLKPTGPSRKGIFLSIEKAKEQACVDNLNANGFGSIVELMGREPPTIYDPEISLYCIEAAVKLLESNRVEFENPFFYLSTTDYVQHKYKPGDDGANDFYSKFDALIGRLDALGCAVGVTADHGMNAKPNILYLESHLRDAAGIDSKVILPITDPYVVHHGALGSYATVYFENRQDIEKSLSFLRGSIVEREEDTGIEAVYTNEEAQEMFKLPSDRIGDLVVIGNKSTAIGKAKEYHDLSALKGFSLRSHGGVAERQVPLFSNVPLPPDVLNNSCGSQMGNNYDIIPLLTQAVSAA